MSGSQMSEVGGMEDGFTTYSEVAERIASRTAPGSSNEYFYESMGEVGSVVSDVISDLNNWVEIVDVRTYRGNVIGIPVRYRWTIKRWAESDTDRWLLDNGWERLAHLKADSRSHKDNEMEARYYKEFRDWRVFVNFYVEFTEDVFEKLNSGGLDGSSSSSGDMNHLDAVREMKRSE